MFQAKTLPSTNKKPHSKTSKQITCKLFVGNLATHTTSVHLQTIFQSYGQIIECVKVRERYGFVRFATNDQSQRALNACNGLQLNGYPMIVEYAQNEILISPKSPRVVARYQTRRIPIIIHDDMPELRYSSSTLNPDASSFTIHCSTSDYYSQSERPSSRSSSERSNCLSPSILSATVPLSYSDDDREEEVFEEKHSQKIFHHHQQQQQRQSVNVFIGDKILNLYGSNVDVNNNHTAVTFDNRDIDPRDPIFIWNFAIYPDVSINPFIKRSDIKNLLERRVSLYS